MSSVRLVKVHNKKEVWSHHGGIINKRQFYFHKNKFNKAYLHHLITKKSKRKFSSSSSSSMQQPRTILCNLKGRDANFDDYETPLIPDSLPVVEAETDWREYRNKLFSKESNRPASRQKKWTKNNIFSFLEENENKSWAHPIARPEVGCILIAHPLMFNDNAQSYFSQAVIFIYAHEESGSAGLILNRPTQYFVSEINGIEHMCPEFERNKLYLGGDVGLRTLHLIHNVKTLKGSIEILDGVFLGGFDHVKEAVANGECKSSDIKWYARYCGWGPGQLQNEIELGVWFAAACSADLILQDCDTRDAPSDTWHQVLHLLGGEYAELSASVKQAYDPDIMRHLESEDE